MPIYLPVGARPDDRSFKQVADKAERYFSDAGRNIGKEFSTRLADGMKSSESAIRKSADNAAKAYDKAANAAGQARVEEAKLQDLRKKGAGDTAIIAQAERLEKARRAEFTTTRTATSALNEFSAAQRNAAASSGLLSNLLQGISNGAAGTQFGVMAGQAAGLSDKLSSISGASRAAAIGVGGLTVGVAAGVKALYDLGSQLDDVGDRIAGRTGKIGGDLDAINDSVRRVGSNTAAPIGEIGDIAGQVVQSLGLTGPALDTMTKRLADLHALSGENVNVRELGKAYRLFDINDITGQTRALDSLNTVSQKTGIGVNELIGTLTSTGKAAKEFGLGFGQTAGLISSLEEAGVDFTKAAPSLSIALKNFAKDGKAPAQGLRDTITEIKKLTDAGRDAEAANLAQKTFGRGYIDFLNAIKNNKLDVDTLDAALRGLGATIPQLRKETEDWHEEWNKLANTFTGVVAPAADFMFGAINSNLTGLKNLALAPLKLFEITPVPSAADLGVPANPGTGNPLLAPYQGGPTAGNQLLPTDALSPQTPGATGPNSYGTPPERPARGWGLPGMPGFNARPDANAAATNIPASQWSIDNIPIGQFQGLNPGPAPAATPPQIGQGPGSFVVDPQRVFDAETALITQRQQVESARSRLLELDADNNASAADINAAKTAVIAAERGYLSDQAKLVEAQQGAWKSMSDSAKSFAGGMDQIGAALDKDLGISKGLPGLAENLVKFLANLAAAPLLGQLSAISQANPNQGSGLMGLLGSQGVFGQQFVSGGQAPSYGYNPSSIGPAALQPGLPAPTMLEDTGKVPSGPQSRLTAALVERFFGSQLRGKIGGSRDGNTAPGTHDAGLSIDIPIGPDQMSLGDQINAFIQANASTLGVEYSIWRDKGQYPGGGGFTQPGHQNHIDVHFNGQQSVNAPYNSGAVPAPSADFSSFGAPGSKQAIANMIYQQALGRGYSAHEAQSIVAYAVGESGLNPGISGGVQGDDEVLGLFQQKSAFAAAGGIDPSQRTDPVANTYAYLNQLEQHRNLPIEQALPATSIGGPLASGPGAQPQNWNNLMNQAAGYLGGGGATSGAGLPGLAPAPQGIGPATLGVSPALAPPNPWSPGPTGLAYPSNPGGGGAKLGGMAMDGLMGAAGAADLLFPGAGSLAKMGIQVLNRTIQYGSEAAGIGASGILETLSIGDNPRGSLGSSWFGKVLGGIAGAAPALPNMAGEKAQGPGQGGGGQGQGNVVNNTYNANVTNNRATEDQNANSARRELEGLHSQPGRQ